MVFDLPRHSLGLGSTTPKLYYPWQARPGRLSVSESHGGFMQSEGLCCVGRSVGTAGTVGRGESDGVGQLLEGRRQPVVGWCVGGNVVGAAPEVLHEGVPGGKDAS